MVNNIKVSATVLVAISIVFCALTGICLGADGDMGFGTEPLTDGSADYPYLIEDVNDFDVFAGSPSYWASGVHTRLACNPNLADRTYTTAVIASDTDNTSNGFQGTGFSGIFDGGGHVISNLTISALGHDYVGLFGRAVGQIVNLGIENTSIQARNYVGGLAGTSDTITNCYSTGSISGFSYVGGLSGKNNNSATNCYSNSSVDGDSYVGGLFGVYGSRKGRGYPENCYSSGSVSGTSDVGGLVGVMGLPSDTFFTSCFWDIETSGQTASAVGIGKTTAQMKDINTFLVWSCDPVWTIDPGVDYPRLSWQGALGVLIIKPAFGGGSGTQADPYIIYTAEQFVMIGKTGCDLDKHFLLMGDIDLSAYDGNEGRPDYEPVGTSETPFSGVFNGNDLTISNLNYTSNSDQEPAGLFGRTSDAVIRNLRLHDIYLEGMSAPAIGGLVGISSYSDFENCYVIGGQISGTDSVGGLAGSAQNGIISQCSVNIMIQADGQYSGLLAGYSYGVNMNSSFSDGILTGTISSGGLIGAGSWFQIANCYSRANITGEEDTGGLVGTMKFEGTSIINSYAAGSVSGQTQTGGLVGSCSTGVVADCYWDADTTEQSYSAGGGMGLANEDMMKKGTYLGWGCGSEWIIDPNNDYPRLTWEGTAGETITKPTIVYGGGQGTVEYPHLIFTAEQFHQLSLLECDWGYSFKLMDDIDMGPYMNNQFSGIGFPRQAFTGNFDGNNKKIINLTLNGDGRGYAGMFGYISGVGNVIKNIYLENLNIQTGGGYTAGLIGRNQADDIVIENCHILSGSVHGGNYTGGLIGYSLYGDNITVLNCSSAAEVHGTSKVGGLLGYCSDAADVYTSFATGDVYGTSEVGGFIGRASNPMAIYDSYATGDVHGTTEVGGFLGEIWDYWYPVTVYRCYSTGEVTGDDDIGGFCSDDESIYNSYWNIDTSNLTYSGDATGLSDVDFKKQSSFVSWDFVGESTNGTDNNWRMCVDGVDYPRLAWQWPIGDVTCPDGVELADLAYIASRYLEVDCDGSNHCGNADIDRSRDVDWPDVMMLAEHWLEGYTTLEPLDVSLDLARNWMYQNLPGKVASNLTAAVSVTGDASGNSSYSYEWEIVLPLDVAIEPVTVSGGGSGDEVWSFAAGGCDEVGSASDSGQVFTVKVTVVGEDFGNVGSAQAEFGIALLGDVNNDTVVNGADRGIINTFWIDGAAGNFGLGDCDVNCDGVVNGADRGIINTIWGGTLGSNSITNPCPLR